MTGPPGVIGEASLRNTLVLLTNNIPACSNASSGFPGSETSEFLGFTASQGTGVHSPSGIWKHKVRAHPIPLGFVND